MQPNRLRELREKRGYSLSDLEEKTGIKSTSISLQENHKRAIPVESAVRYCDFFNVSLDYFFYRETYDSVFEKYKTEELKDFLKILENELHRRD